MGNRVIIVVSGGLVTSVYSDLKDSRVDVLDYDNMEMCNMDVADEAEEYARYEGLEKEVETLQMIW